MNRSVGLLTKLLAVICTVLIVVAPGSEMWAQADVFGQAPKSGWESSKLSHAVVNDANEAVEMLLLAQQSGHLTPAVLQNAATALQVLFDHFEEIGLNAALQKQILNNQQAFLDFHPSDAQVATYQAQLGSHGITASAERIRSVMDPSVEMRQEFVSTIKRIGLAQAELAVVAQLKEEAQSLSTSGASSVQLSRMFSPTAHLVLVMSASCAACFVLAGIGLASGCTLTAAACGAGIGVCTVCAFGG